MPTIVLRDDAETRTVAHEIGHAIDYAKLTICGRWGWSQDARIRAAYQSDRYAYEVLGMQPLSRYGLTNPQEYWAEGFMYYMGYGGCDCGICSKDPSTLPQYVTLHEVLKECFDEPKG